MSKNKFQLKSIELKIALWAGFCLLLVAAGIITYAAVLLRRAAVDIVQEQTVALAEIQAAVLKDKMDMGLNTAQTLAQALAAIKSKEQPATFTRGQVNAMFRQVLADNPEFLGVYTLWEPNAFDGADAQFAGQPAHDETGRFIPYWYRNNQGEIVTEALQNYETEEWYLCPKQTQQECVVDPYLYPLQGQEVLMTTLAVPIIADGQFYGVAGVDLRLDFLQQLIDQHHLDNGVTGTLALISYNGTLAGVSGQPELIGQNAEMLQDDLKSAGELATIQQGQKMAEFQDDELDVYVPVTLGQTNTPWAVNLISPTEVIMAEATWIVWQLIAVGIGLCCLGLGLVWFAARRIARPIKQITGAAQAVTGGNLTATAAVTSPDEIGLLAVAFNQMTGHLRQRIEAEQIASEKAGQLAESERKDREYLQQTVNHYLAFVERVTTGDLSTRLTLNGHNDALTTLGHNLNTMVEDLGDLSGQIRQATANIAAASAEILAATTSQASGAAEQSAAIAQTTTTIDEVRTIVEQSYAKAQAVAEQARRTREVAQTGQKAVIDTVDGMSQIKERVV